MSNDESSHPMAQGGKLSKEQKKLNHENEQFYVKKRGLFRKAEQVVKYTNSEVFIIVHKKDSDKIFSFTSDAKFNLQKISALVLRDCQQSAILQKNKKFVDEDFDQIMTNIKEIKKINQAVDPNETLPMEKMQKLNDEFLLQGRNGVEPETLTETMTEDMSMSMQMQYSSAQKNIQPRNARPPQMRDNTPPMYKSPKAGVDVKKLNQQFRNNDASNEISNQGVPTPKNRQSTISSIQPLPIGGREPAKQQYESPAYKQEEIPLQLNNQNYAAAAPFHQPYPTQFENPVSNNNQFTSQQPQTRNDLTPRSHQFNNQRQSIPQNQNRQSQVYNNNYYQQPQSYQQQNAFPKQFFPQQKASDSFEGEYVENDKSKHASKVSVDIHAYNKEKFNNLQSEMKQLPEDNDDIFLCYDRDDMGGNQYNNYQQPNQLRSGVDSAPGHNSGVPGKRKENVINMPKMTQLSGVSMQNRFPSQIAPNQGTNNQGQASTSQQFFKSQVQNQPEINSMQRSNQFFKNNVHKVSSIKLDQREFQQPTNIMSPTSHFDQADIITSPRDNPRDQAPQGMPIGGIGLRGQNIQTRKSFMAKKHSQISNISIQKPNNNAKGSMGLASINSSMQEQDDKQYKVTSGVLGHNNRVPNTYRDHRDRDENMDNEEESFDQNFQYQRRQPMNQSISSGFRQDRQLNQLNTQRNPTQGNDFTPKLRNEVSQSRVVNISGTNSRGNSQVSNQRPSGGSGGFNNSLRRNTSGSGSNGSGVRSIRSGLIKNQGNQSQAQFNQQYPHNSRQGSGSRINDPSQFNANNDFYR